ncbi:hypothetical protein HETIRDRAFT_453806 [Heterobasidion irregulare TC 32-1]|uniref:Serine/threonine-protein phosphatase 4 regulatory subunit 3-like central domain-containing protein n=1 Tax=Heterobasidion irregulare (strain TC 32-1) TaxID=747525 RepID=W4K212_HETIT|nr:uncharacterized protein HETIRDRAFT_453806 [Heterobasidion irregulare TC 32-1]ETW79380.1 hypothetical protein HETIRDRAFT_453806 [Heterobasidion irregulare TC 32-1]
MPLPDGANPMCPGWLSRLFFYGQQILMHMFLHLADDPKTQCFLDCFYKLCVTRCSSPSSASQIASCSQVSPSVAVANPNLPFHVYATLTRLPSIFALQHTLRSHFFMLTLNISTHVARLLCSRDKHLCLGASALP